MPAKIIGNLLYIQISKRKSLIIIIQFPYLTNLIQITPWLAIYSHLS